MLKNDLEQFYGTEHYYSIPDKDIVLTDGVAYFTKKTNNLDLITHMIDIISNSNEPFVTVDITSSNSGIVVQYTDGNYNKIAEPEPYPTIYFDNGEYKFFCCDNVLMLASEY